MSVGSFFYTLFFGFVSLPQLFSNQLSQRLPVCFMLFTSLFLALLTVLMIYFIVNRKKTADFGFLSGRSWRWVGDRSIAAARWAWLILADWI